MGRLPRRLSTVAAAASAVLCVGACGLWVRSYWRFDRVSHAPGDGRGRYMELVSDGGRLRVSRFDDTWTDARGWAWTDATQYGPSADALAAMSDGQDYLWRGEWEVRTARARAGVNVTRGRALVRVDGVGARFWTVSLGYWHAAAALAVVPAGRAAAAALARRTRARGTARNRCGSCGYDLRATPQEDGALLSRCPECGAVPGAGKGAA